MMKTEYALAWRLLLCALPGTSLAFEQCAEQARGRYEEIYCAIKAKGEGRGLPSLEDFRRNDTRVQALLLKRPAARLGIDVPEPKKTRPRPPAAAVTRPKAAAKAGPASQKPAAAARSGRPKAAPAVAPGVGSCRFLGQVISCGGSRYELALNRQNSALADGVLGEKNRMGLQAYTGKPGDRAALLRYLSASYRRYIEKMLEIGLGSATMSFTKFYYTHQTISQQGEDFAARFETMFSFLKKDKAGMSIKPRYHDQLPGSIGDCSELSARLIVCEAGENNWVYVKQRPAG